MCIHTCVGELARLLDGDDALLHRLVHSLALHELAPAASMIYPLLCIYIYIYIYMSFVSVGIKYSVCFHHLFVCLFACLSMICLYVEVYMHALGHEMHEYNMHITCISLHAVNMGVRQHARYVNVIAASGYTSEYAAGICVYIYIYTYIERER